MLGKAILIHIETFSTASFESVPECNSNTVTFFKVEDIAANCRNLLALNEELLCYSVTGKKNLLRAIHTDSGQKAVLRGHENFILDMTFSSLNNEFICSVDSGPSNPRTIVWKKEVEAGNSEEFVFKLVFEVPYGATKVTAHPLLTNYWAVGDGQVVAVFSHADQTLKTLKAGYRSFPLSVEAAEQQRIVGEK